MQAGRRGASSTSQGRESTSFNHEFQSDPGFSWTSTYAARSPPKVSKNGKSSRSFWEVVDTITGGCTSCFAPRQSKIKEGHVKPSNDGHDISISSSTRTRNLEKHLLSCFSLILNIDIIQLSTLSMYGSFIEDKCLSKTNKHILLLNYQLFCI